MERRKVRLIRRRLAKSYLEVDDPRLTNTNDCFVDYFIHAQTLTIIVTQLDGQLVETIRIPVEYAEEGFPLKRMMKAWHENKCYLIPIPSRGNGRKRYLRENPLGVGAIKLSALVKPKVEPPWVTNPDLFGSWRPSPLKYEGYHLIEVMIDGEKCFVCWRNLSQKCDVSLKGTPLEGIRLDRGDGTYLRVAPFHLDLNLPPYVTDHYFTMKAYSRINPPGSAPDGLLYSRSHDVDMHLSYDKPKALESEYSVNYSAMVSRDSCGDINTPLDDDGHPLLKGSANGFEVFVERERYWKECYLSVSILNGMTIGLQRTNGTHELVQFTVTNEHVLKAMGKMVDAWRELWPDQIPGFVCDLSPERSAEPAINSQDHWFNASYGFERQWVGVGTGKICTKLPGGGTETEADISVREVSNGFGLRLVFGDGSQKVIHFHTADLMDKKKEIGDLMNVWNTLQGDTMGIFQTWPTFREEGASWSLNSIARFFQ